MTDEKYLKKLGEKIVELRKKQGISQKSLASKLDIDRTSLFRIEQGQVNSSITTLRTIAKELGISIGELVNIK